MNPTPKLPSLLPLPLLALILLAPLPARATFVYETPTEFHAAGDFDGDGRTDVLVVDRATGVARFGYLDATLTLEWTLPRATGIEDVSGISVGHLFSLTVDSLVAASPAANRVNILHDPARDTLRPPLSAYPHGIGAQTPLVLDIGGAGNNAYDDLLVSSIHNHPTPYAVAFLRSPAVTNFYSYSAPAPMARANAVRMDPARVPFAAYLDRTPGAGLKVLDLTNALPLIALSIPNLSATADYAAAPFGTNLFNFLVYEPGSAALASYRVAKSGAGYVVASTNVFNLTNAIARVSVARAAQTNRVMVVFQGDLGARLYDYDGAAQLAPLQTISVVGGAYLPLDASGTNVLVHLAADPATGRSANATVLSWNGSKFVAATPTAPLPALGSLSGKANVLLFRNEPFVHPNPDRVAAWNAGDWSTAAALTVGATRVTYAADRGTATGLVALATTNLARPAAANYVLGNQPTNAFSVFCLSPADGTAVPVLSISPPAGRYNAAILVSLSNNAALPMHVQLDGATAWTPYTNAFYLFKDSTLRAYAGAANSAAKSPILAAAYTFADPPDLLDSDSDGIPDYVEIALGLDPLGQTPDDPSAAAPLDAILSAERNAVFDQIAIPRPYDGIASQTVYAATSTAVYALAPGGGLLANQPVQRTNAHDGTTYSNSVRFSSLPLGAPPFVAVATEPNFGVNTPGPTKARRIGRELLAILPVPDPAPLAIPHAYSNGTLSAEATNWIAAANAALVATSRPVAVAHLSPTNTLAALLFERFAADVLRDRGVFTNHLATLFPHRPSDSLLPAITADDLAAIQRPSDPAQTAYQLSALLDRINTQLRTNNTAHVVRLRTLARDVYSACSRYNDASNAMLRPPPSVLREFIATRTLDPAYTNYLRWTPAQFGSAYTGAVVVLQSIAPRTLRTLDDLSVQSNSFADGLSTLFDPSGTPWRLQRADATPYPFTAAFTLPTGTLFSATGYDDLPPAPDGASVLEVVQLLLARLPDPPRNPDQLLPDEWQRLFFGLTGVDPFADSDSDGYSNLQEYLARTNPADPADAPPVPPADFAHLDVVMQLDTSSTMLFLWTWPADYLEDFSFNLQEAPTLFDGFTNKVAVPLGQTQQQIPRATNAPTGFYRLRFSVQ
jgi:hypothetical protein